MAGRGCRRLYRSLGGPGNGVGGVCCSWSSIIADELAVVSGLGARVVVEDGRDLGRLSHMLQRLLDSLDEVEGNWSRDQLLAMDAAYRGRRGCFSGGVRITRRRVADLPDWGPERQGSCDRKGP